MTIPTRPAWIGLAAALALASLGPLAPLPLPAHAEQGVALDRAGRFHPALGHSGMVASDDAEATRIGVETLRRGGNAVDAAVAAAFALAVTLPQAGNLGGGGFMLVHRAEGGETVALDFRETAPARASRDLFLNEQGEVDARRSRFSPLAVAVPGTVAGLALAAGRLGTRPLAELIAPAVRLAEGGIEVRPALAADLAAARERLAAWPAARAIFLRPDGEPLGAGERLVQRDLAASLRAIAAEGPPAFYAGAIGAAIVGQMAATGGLITAADLAGYRALVRAPVRGRYRGYDIASMPPPSSGGVHLIEMLNVLEGFPLKDLGAGSAAAIHLMAEAMKRAYADRAEHLGDPAFARVPVAGLTSPAYAAGLRAAIDPARATPARDIRPGDPLPFEGPNTTHLSVIDRLGNAVALTTTLNFAFGSGIVAEGTGILLNNEMDDFSAKPGVPNAYGLVGGAANAIAGGKRPLSSMTPTIVLRGGAPVLVTGSPGGSRIITTVLQVVVNVVDFGMNPAEAVAAPRVHHQWLPDEIRIERGLSPDTVALLAARGHTVVEGPTMGSAVSVARAGGVLYGAADPRRPDGLALGY